MRFFLPNLCSEIFYRKKTIGNFFKQISPRYQGILPFLLFLDTYGKGWKVLEGWKVGLGLVMMMMIMMIEEENNV